MKKSLKRRIEKEVREDVKRRAKGFFTSPATYIGAGLQALTIIAIRSNPDIAKEDMATKASYIGAMVFGQGILFYSFFRNVGTFTEYANNLTAYWKMKKQQRAQWKWFSDVLAEFKRLEIPELEGITMGGKRVLGEREDFGKAYGLAQAGFAILKKRDRADLRQIGEKQEPPVADEKYMIVPIKAYNRLSRNQQLRVQYFADEVSGIGTEQRLELYRGIRKSRWYEGTMTDMQTYTFFDDIMLSIRKDPSLSQPAIERYIDGVVKQPPEPVHRSA